MRLSLLMQTVFVEELLLHPGAKAMLACRFGTFQLRERAARRFMNPQTKEMMDLPASIAPAFTASKVLKIFLTLSITVHACSLIQLSRYLYLINGLASYGGIKTIQKLDFSFIKLCLLQ